MKLYLSILLVVFSLSLQAEGTSQLKLSTTLNESRMGKWVKNDFVVWIEMNELERFLKESVSTFAYSLNNYTYTDSSGVIFYRNSTTRYEKAIAQLQQAPHGLDLRTLIVYRGVDNKKNDVGNSGVIESRVKQMLMSGNAVVYYKGKRIDALQVSYESIGDNLLNSGTCASFYYENMNHLLYKDCQIYGW